MKSFKSYYTIPASPEDVYHALTDTAILERWTGEAAEMSVEPGTEFSLWEGSITGKNLEFVKDKMIVQEWYFGEQPEKSIVTIKLHMDKAGTSVELNHTNIPDEAYEDITAGWGEAYFGALKEFYE